MKEHKEGMEETYNFLKKAVSNGDIIITSIGDSKDFKSTVFNDIVDFFSELPKFYSIHVSSVGEYTLASFVLAVAGETLKNNQILQTNKTNITQLETELLKQFMSVFKTDLMVLYAIYQYDKDAVKFLEENPVEIVDLSKNVKTQQVATSVAKDNYWPDGEEWPEVSNTEMGKKPTLH